MARQLRHEDYTVGWVCALPIELAAATEMLDEQHVNLQRNAGDKDENLYTLGSIGGHNVAIVCLPAGRIGNNPAATVATQMLATFKAIRFGLMVGIGGGVPAAADIRLGDVVVSQPFGRYSGVVQYDMGKSTPSGFEWTGSLNSPPHILLEAIAQLRASEMRGVSLLSIHMSKLERLERFQRSRAGADVLFDAEYGHEGERTCDQCKVDRRKIRLPRESGKEIAVHYGTIASGNQVMRNATVRDKISAELGNVLCFEMEAAGLMNSFPCLVVRGICDYCDSHKNKTWQPYAAATAAAYAKEVLLTIPPLEVAVTELEIKSRKGDSERESTSAYYLHFPKNRYFTGRQDELNQLKQSLLVHQDCRELSLLGLGGTGKTQVALQFAYHVKETQPEFSVFWVSAVSMASFDQACLGIAEKLDILQGKTQEEDPKELVKQHLSSDRAGPWLLIVDNADDMNIFFGDGQSEGISKYLPQSENGLIVYTTRTPEVAEQACRDIIEVGAMNRQDAMDFLKNSLRNKKHLNSYAIAKELLDELAHLPLAIAQAAAYLNRNSTPIQRYLRLLRNTEKDMVSLLKKEFQDNTRYKESANAVATTWVVSFNQIQERHRPAADLLAFMSCIEWKAIPRSLLPPAQSELDMEDAIGILCGYSLITRRGDDGTNSRQEDDESAEQEEWDEQEEQEEWYDIHRLVHLATKVWTSEYGDAAKVVTKALRHVEEVFPTDEWENRELWRSYFPHALRVLENSKDSNASDKSSLCLYVGNCLLVDKRFREAIELLGESCRLRDILDEDDPNRLSSQHSLALAYIGIRQVQKAVELLEYVVRVREALAEGHPDRLASQQVLAGAYLQDGQVQKALELLEHIVEVEGKLLEEGHTNRLASQHELARAYLEDRQVQKALELLEHIVEVEGKLLEEGHTNRLASQHELARAYLEDRQVQKAVELLEYVVRVREALAEGHPDRLASQQVLAGAYLQDGQVQKALELLEHVVRVREALAEGHPSQLESQHELARAYYMSGQAQKAVELLEHVVEVEAQVLRDGHPSRMISVRVLQAFHAKLRIGSGDETSSASG